MLLRLLKNNHAPGVIFLGILMILLWLRSFIALPEQTETDAMPMFDLLFGWTKERPTLGLMVSMVLFAWIMFLLNRLNVVHFLLEERSNMPSAFFLMIAASYPSALQVSPVLIGGLSLVASLLVLIRGEEHRAEPMALFNATLLLALGSLFYLKTILYIPFLWMTATIIRPLKWRGIINPLLVLVMMGLFSVTWYWVIMDDLPRLFSLLEEKLTFSIREFPGLNFPVLILIGYLIFLVIISSGYLLKRYQFRKIIIRKLYQVLFLLFIYGLIFYVFLSGYRPEILIMIAIPVSFLLANFFHRRKNHWTHELMIVIWLLLIAYVQLAPFLPRKLF